MSFPHALCLLKAQHKYRKSVKSFQSQEKKISKAKEKEEKEEEAEEKEEKIPIVNYEPKRQRFQFVGASGHIPVGKRPLQEVLPASHR